MIPKEPLSNRQALGLAGGADLLLGVVFAVVGAIIALPFVLIWRWRHPDA